MKISLLLFIFLLFPVFSNAKSNHILIYSGVSVAKGYPHATIFQTHLSGMYRQYTGSILFTGCLARARNRPDNYDAGMIDLGGPFDNYWLLGPAAGRVFFMNKHIRFNARCGILGGKIRVADNFYRNPGSIVQLGPNYGYVFRNRFSAGFMANPTFEFTLTKGWGLSLGMTSLLLAGEKPLVTLDLGIIWGALRDRKTPNP